MRNKGKTERDIFEILSFHKNAIARKIAPLEVWRMYPQKNNTSFSEFFTTLETLSPKIGHPHFTSSREGDVIADKKWHRLLRYRRLFQFIPFVDFVLTAGSLALGNPHEKSDFDIIVGAKEGRIFTARFCCAALFELFGIRRRRLSGKSASKNKVCFGHFVTTRTYELTSPRDSYWVYLYRNLVPIFGSPGPVGLFFEANRWADTRFVIDDIRWLKSDGNSVKKFFESSLNGRFGNILERILGGYQKHRIKKHLKEVSTGFEPRFRYDAEELVFHMNTRRAKEMSEKADKELPTDDVMVL